MEKKSYSIKGKEYFCPVGCSCQFGIGDATRTLANAHHKPMGELLKKYWPGLGSLVAGHASSSSLHGKVKSFPARKIKNIKET